MWDFLWHSNYFARVREKAIHQLSLRDIVWRHCPTKAERRTYVLLEMISSNYSFVFSLNQSCYIYRVSDGSQCLLLLISHLKRKELLPSKKIKQWEDEILNKEGLLKKEKSSICSAWPSLIALLLIDPENNRYFRSHRFSHMCNCVTISFIS